MYLKEETIYLSGLFDLAASVSKNIGPSAFDVICYEKGTYQKELLKSFKIKEDIKFFDSNLSFKDLLKALFGEDKSLIEGMDYHLVKEIGMPKKILTIDHKYLELFESSTRGFGSFYIVEDLYVLETDDKDLVIILGNNE